MAQELLGPRGSEFIGALKQARVEFVAALPDISTSRGFLWPLAQQYTPKQGSAGQIREFKEALNPRLAGLAN